VDLDLERRWCLEIAGQGEDIGLDTELCQALDEEVDGGDEGDVRDVSGSVSTSEYATNPADGIDNHRPRVSRCREWARVRVARQYRYFLRHLTGYAV